jgi:hypothetical protein
VKFTVTIHCDNTAFEEDLEGEVARILRGIADRAETAGLDGLYQTILDANGNDVGRYALKNDDGTIPEREVRP